MLTQNQIKQIKSLHQKKNRTEEKLFIAEGPKLVEEMLGSKFTFAGIYAKKEWLTDNSDRLINKNISFTEINDKELERISTQATPNKVLAVINIPEQIIPMGIFGKELILMLDDIKDPGNLGTIIRTANWFGINHIFCSENSSELYNPKVVQSTMGSIAKVNVYYTNLSTLLKANVNGVNVYGTFMNGESIYNISPDKNGVIIIGNESGGISDDLLSLVTKKIAIPLHKNQNQHSPESLNASIATAILCYEFRR